MRIERKIGYLIIAAMFAGVLRAVWIWNILSVVALLVAVIVIGLVLGAVFERLQARTVANQPAHLERASFTPNGQVITVNSDGGIYLYAAEHWTRLRHVGSLPVCANRYALSGDGCFVARVQEETDGEPSSVSLSEISTGNQVCAIEFDGHVSSVLISPEGSSFGLVDHSKAIHLWNGKTGEPVPVFSDDSRRAASCRFAELIAFSPDGRFLSAGEEDAVYIWDLKLKELVQVLGGHSHISALSYSPDGTLLAVADENTIRIWDPDSGEKLHVIEELFGARHLVFSPDGRLLLGDDNTHILWFADVITGMRLVDSSVDNARFRCLSFSPDGRQVLALSEEARLYRWLLDDDRGILSTEMLADSVWVSATVR